MSQSLFLLTCAGCPWYLPSLLILLGFASFVVWFCIVMCIYVNLFKRVFCKKRFLRLLMYRNWLIEWETKDESFFVFCLGIFQENEISEFVIILKQKWCFGPWNSSTKHGISWDVFISCTLCVTNCTFMVRSISRFPYSFRLNILLYCSYSLKIPTFIFLISIRVFHDYEHVSSLLGLLA